jgi:hypothetical protein
MAGLTLIALLVVWVSACAVIANWAARKWKTGSVRVIVRALIFTVVFLLPVADELLARPQFAALCREGAVLRIDAEKIKGKTIRLEISPKNQVVEKTPIPILHSRYSYREATTNEELAHYDVYAALGGFMSQWTGFPEGRHPWTIERSTCVPPDEGTLAKRYQFSLIN